MNYTLDELALVLADVGIQCDVEAANEAIDVADSLQYISAIVEIEKRYGIEFPDDYLDGSAFTSLSFLLDIIKEKNI